MSRSFRKFAQKLGNKVRLLRKERGWSQERLAHEANIERSYMGAIERGERNPTLKKIYQISVALRVPARELFNY